MNRDVYTVDLGFPHLTDTLSFINKYIQKTVKQGMIYIYKHLYLQLKMSIDIKQISELKI